MQTFSETGFAFQRLAPGGATGNEVAEFLDITKQAASEMVDYLEQHGYVTRQPPPRIGVERLLPSQSVAGAVFERRGKTKEST